MLRLIQRHRRQSLRFDKKKCPRCRHRHHHRCFSSSSAFSSSSSSSQVTEDPTTTTTTTTTAQNHNHNHGPPSHYHRTPPPLSSPLTSAYIPPGVLSPPPLDDESMSSSHHPSPEAVALDSSVFTNPQTQKTPPPPKQQQQQQQQDNDDKKLILLRTQTAELSQQDKTLLGSYTPEQWNQAKDVLIRWTLQTTASRPPTPESVDQSFCLLDRLVLEQEVQQYHDLSVHLLNTWLLNRIVYNWNRSVGYFATYSMEDQALLRFEYTPMEMLARLEDYSHRSPHLQAATRTLNLIMDGASRCSRIKPVMISPRVATNFSQSLFDRMILLRDESSSLMMNPRAPPQQQQQQQDKDQNEQNDNTNTHNTNPIYQPPHHHPNYQNHYNPPAIRPDTETYACLIQLFARNGLATRAEALLDRMYKEFKDSNHDPQLTPTANIFTSVLSAWSHSGEPHAPERAELILQRMQELSDCGLLPVQPDAVTYTVVLNCWARKTRRNKFGSGKNKNHNQQHNNNNTQASKVREQSVERAWKLFSKMKQLGHTDTMAYNVMMNILARDGRVKEVEELLREMDANFAATGSEEARPTSSAYNTLLTAWARSGTGVECANRAEAILKDFESKYEAGAVQDPPNLVTYNSVLLCLAQAQQADRAKALLDKMKETQETFGNDIRPDTISWNTTINAYAKSKEPQKAEALLETWFQEYTTTQDPRNAPNVDSFSTVLTAWLKSDDPKAAERAQAILRTMQKIQKASMLDVGPNTVAYNICITLWYRSTDREAPYRAEKLLNEMEELYNGGSQSVQPDAMTYEEVMGAFGKRRNARKAEEILERRHFQSLSTVQGGGCNLNAKPQAGTYKKVLGAYKRDTKKGAADRSEALLRRWQGRYDEGTVPFAPDEESLQLVLDAWYNAAGHNPNAGKRAMTLMQEIQNGTFSSQKNIGLGLEAHEKVIETFVKRQDAESAEEYWKWMCSEFLQGNTQEGGTVNTFNKVLGAWRKSASHAVAGKRIDALFKYAQDNSELKLRPNHASYKIFLNTLDEDPQPSVWAGLQASQIMEEMERLRSLDDDGSSKTTKPNAQDYTQVLRIWSKLCQEDPEAYRHADIIFQKMKDNFDTGRVHCTPTMESYRLLIHVWSASNDPSAQERIRHLKAEMAELENGLATTTKSTKD